MTRALRRSKDGTLPGQFYSSQRRERREELGVDVEKAAASRGFSTYASRITVHASRPFVDSFSD